MKLVESLRPTHWSMLQRAGAFVTVVSILFVILLHFPFAGYKYDHEVVKNYATKACKDAPTLEELNKMSLDEINASCTTNNKQLVAPFSEWHSNEPVIVWFGSVLNTSVCIGLLLLVGVAWVKLFQVQSTAQQR